MNDRFPETWVFTPRENDLRQLGSAASLAWLSRVPRAIFGQMSYEYTPEFNFRTEQDQDEEDRVNEEEDEDEELLRQEKQDDEEDEDIYSDDMREFD
jgi:hypothetical protein